ncbi:MAG: diacylglycerol kinase family protein [Bacteroides caccae]|nr:diacylglycerol kinase family protein [Bacteroides caccae]
MNERMKKIIFVVNPISGTQSKELILSLLNEKIDKARYSWEVVYTERAGHAVEIAAKAAEEKADIVVAIGGDGTINEIARSLVHTDTALGIIPCGSGNGLARHLHIPMEPKKALEVLNEGCMDVIDYGKINGTDFFCTCGVGFDAFVSLKFAHAGKRGLLTYLEKTLQESLKYQPETYELETDADVNIELIQRGLRVVVPQAAEKDAANVLQRAQEYMNGIKLMNEAIVDNITDRNKKILKKLTKKG